LILGSITDSSNISCYGFSDGWALVTPSCGTTPYTYLWDDPQSTSGSTVTGISAGLYYHITITDAHNCTITDSVILSEPDILTASITDSSNISCYGLSDGLATVTPSGGTAPYTYLWDDLQNTSDSTVTGLSAGIYYHVTIIDANNCVITDSVILTINVCDFPYTENFENRAGGWITDGTNSSWERGVPDGPTINSAASGDSAWVTNLSGDHNNNELSFVYSPVFDFTGFSEPYISMSIWYDCEDDYDGANLQYSTDGGSSWQIVGVYFDGCFKGWNWYNKDGIESLFLGFNSNSNLANGWSGDDNGEGSGAWITATHDLPGLGGLSNVRFRFVFGSNESIVNDGFAFDSICIGSKDDIITSANLFTEETSELKIYPNPFTGTTTIEFPNPGKNNYKLTVTDLTGKTVRIIDNITGNRVIFNRRELPVGFYLIEIRGAKRYIGKMLIE